MKKILIITTGGTIACENTAEGLTPVHGGNDLIKGISGCDTEILDLFSCDSTDISPEHWKMLYKAVRNSENYDGIVILHGTDTLEYTAAMLYFTASDINKPVILTGSMLPFAEKGSDGPKNISDSVLAACDDRLKGVYVVFCGRIIGGSEAVKRNSLKPDAFRSFSGKDCGLINENGIILSKVSETVQTMNVPEKSKKIAVIKLTPFTEEIYVPEGYSGAVIESFGAGGIPDRQPLLRSAEELCRRMPVIMTTGCTCGAKLCEYEVGQRAVALGIKDGGGMSTACAAVRLWIEA